jgi:hypothetical protein
MNPMSILLLLALGRGEKKGGERHFDKGLLLALAFSGLTGQSPAGPSPSPGPTPSVPGSFAPQLDPNMLLLLAMGTDLFGPRLEERREEIKKLVTELIGLGLTAGQVSANISL